MTYHHTFDSPIGHISMTEEEDAITYIGITNAPCSTDIPTPLLSEAQRQVSEYLHGERSTMNFPIRMRGTDFQVRVWKALQQIPYGSTSTYGTIATKLNNERAARAVGMACNRNPLLLAVPCHRVIGTGGKLTGFACGVDIKLQLLKLEHRK